MPQPLLIAAILIVALNLATWATYRWDKRAAGMGKRRIPERNLLLLAAAGGVAGAFVAVYGHGQRHKAQKSSFMLPLYAIAVGWLVVVAVVIWLVNKT